VQQPFAIGGEKLREVWLESRRVTEDIDLVGTRPDSRLRLMELAERLGLPIEAMNSAADFFVRRISDAPLEARRERLRNAL
jgi:hypothetical protein